MSSTARKDKLMIIAELTIELDALQAKYDRLKTLYGRTSCHIRSDRDTICRLTEALLRLEEETA